MLNIKDLNVAYGGIQAVKHVSLDVKQGELITLIGANGAGKTTLMKAITGIHPIKSGDIHYINASIKGKPSYELLKQGLVMVPEGRGVFARMTILDNLKMGAYLRKDFMSITQDIERVFIFFPRLKERCFQLAGTMSGGEQQMLAMARAYMSRPKLLLLDEPSMGLSPIMVSKVFEFIRILYEEGITILLVEQNARAALKIATRGYVMESGEIIMNAEAKILLNDPKVKLAYLGE